MPDAVTGTTSTPPPGVTTTAPTTGFNSVTGASGATKSTKPGGDLDKDAFLKLLVAQLKYQNPLSPTNPDQFLAQSAQFTMVEKLEAISKAQADLTVWQKVTAGQSLVGRTVTGKSELGVDVTGVVTGLTLGADGPRLRLSDGSTMAVVDVTAVTAPVANPTTPVSASTPASVTTPAGPTRSADPTAASPTTGGSTAPAAAPATPAPAPQTAAGPAESGSADDTAGAPSAEPAVVTTTEGAPAP